MFKLRWCIFIMHSTVSMSARRGVSDRTAEFHVLCLFHNGLFSPWQKIKGCFVNSFVENCMNIFKKKKNANKNNQETSVCLLQSE